MTTTINYDLDTAEGMANAVGWVNQTLSLLREGGVWVIPRSGTTVTVRSQENKTCVVVGSVGEASTVRVLRTAGWTVLNDDKKKK